MRCRECKDKFTPKYFNQKFCMEKAGCISAHVELSKKNSWKQNKVKIKESLKTKSDYLKETQVVFNRFIRLRDELLGCISCGTRSGKMNAGHYMSVGSCPELRFNEYNVHKQCEKCNSFLSGNLINYRIELIKRIGSDKVVFLEGKHEPLHLKIDEILEIRQVYTEKIKRLNHL